LQEGVKPFREKIAIILHESDMNDIKGTPQYYQPDDSEDTDGVEILDNIDHTTIEVSHSSKGTKDATPTTFVPNTPINKNELVCKLRSYIMTIHNADSQE
jgi:hypothetical protein